MDIRPYLVERADYIEPVLARILASSTQEGEVARPERLLEAMKYAVLGGGKRLRPLLVMECAALFARRDEGIVLAAAALEFIHCYSLIHDDLPAMDDDDLRRGRPTVHKAYDEATAILAGDALLTLAFDVIAREAVHPDAAIRLKLSQELARASGLGGMAGGQMLDLESEGHTLTGEQIRTLQAMKTGALLRYACRTGAILANAPNEDIRRLTRFGEIIGLIFQLADDLLDVEASPDKTGKATGKDAEAGKATLVALHGPEAVKAEVEQLLGEAQNLLEPFGKKADILSAISAFIAHRDY